MSMQETNSDLKEIKKLKRINIFLFIFAAFINLIVVLAVLAVSVWLLVVFGMDMFDDPFDSPPTRWYSDNPQIELVIEENFEDKGQGHPITITIDGQKETYYIFIYNFSRSVYILKGSNPDNSPEIISGAYNIKFNKFIIEINQCNDVRFSQYDKIVLYKGRN